MPLLRHAEELLPEHDQDGGLRQQSPLLRVRGVRVGGARHRGRDPVEDEVLSPAGEDSKHRKKE